MDAFLNTYNLFFFVDAKIFNYIYFNLRHNCMSKTSIKQFLEFLFPFETQSYLENMLYLTMMSSIIFVPTENFKTIEYEIAYIISVCILCWWSKQQ